MATNGNAMDNEQDFMETEEHTEEYRALVEYGINAKVANKLEQIYHSGINNKTATIIESLVDFWSNDIWCKLEFLIAFWA